MAESHILGKRGEELAVEHLKKKGFRILFQNWKCGQHEIDIIAENQDFIVFAEVKTRNSDFLMHPVTAINRQKQKSIMWAAEGYIKRFNVNKESRFDVLTVIQNSDNFEVEHIENAFYPTLR